MTERADDHSPEIAGTPAGGPRVWSWLFPLLLGSIILADQFTKWLIDRRLAPYEELQIVAGFVSLQYVRNSGAAFGLLQHSQLPHRGIILTLIGAGAFIAIALYARRLPREKRLARVALTLILSGAIGNLIDRVKLGYVIDFVRVYWRSYTWPNFNVADSAITIGVCLLLLDLMRKSGAPKASLDSPVAAEEAAGRTD